MAWGTVLVVAVPVVAVALGGAYYVGFHPHVVLSGTANGREWRVARVRTDGPLSVAFKAEVNESAPGFAANWRQVGSALYEKKDTAKAVALERIATITGAPGTGAPVQAGIIVAQAAKTLFGPGGGQAGTSAAGWPEGYCYNVGAQRFCVSGGVWVQG